MPKSSIYLNYAKTLAPLTPQIPIKSAKYEFSSSNTTRTTFASDACFVWKLTPLVEERNHFFHRIATIDAIEQVFNVGNSYLSLRYRAVPFEHEKTLKLVQSKGRFFRLTKESVGISIPAYAIEQQ
jgi:hypothetical protein